MRPRAHNFLPTNFPRAYHGIESVFEDAAGNLYVIEAKGGSAVLGETRHGFQMSKEWIRDKIRKLGFGDEFQQLWADKLQQAIASQKLYGMVVSTGIDHAKEAVADPEFVMKAFSQIGKNTF